MPSAAEHRAKYDANRTFLDTGLATTQPDWAAVVAFYAAVHLIERLAAAEPRSPIHNGNHAERNRYLGRHRQHRVLTSHYTELQLAASVGRYGTVNQFATDYPASLVQSKLIDTHLVAIEDYVTAYFAPPPPPAPPAPTPPGATGS